ncbi:MAG: glycosyltransferase family 2 protein [Armatimonadota bacterium]
MDITVSIVNWNTRDELGHCLESVLAQEGVRFEIIVVDNASSDESAVMVAHNYPQVTLISNDRNVGFSKAHNQALKIAKGRYIMLVNPDTVLEERDTLLKIVTFADENPDAGIIGPRIENPNGSIQFSARRFPTLGAGLFRRTPLGKLFPNNRFVKSYIMADWKHDEVRDVDWVSGAALVIRQKTIDDIGLLDSGFFMYCEDVDWAYRVKKHGWRVCYYPMAKVKHRIGSASDQAPVRMIYQFHRSMFRFFMKHYAKGLNIVLTPFVFIALAARSLFFIALTRIPISKENGNNGERLVR